MGSFYDLDHLVCHPYVLTPGTGALSGLGQLRRLAEEGGDDNEELRVVGTHSMLGFKLSSNSSQRREYIKGEI